MLENCSTHQKNSPESSKNSHFHFKITSKFFFSKSLHLITVHQEKIGNPAHTQVTLPRVTLLNIRIPDHNGFVSVKNSPCSAGFVFALNVKFWVGLFDCESGLGDFDFVGELFGLEHFGDCFDFGVVDSVVFVVDHVVALDQWLAVLHENGAGSEGVSANVAFFASQKQLPGWVPWVLDHVSSLFNFWNEGGKVLWTGEFRHDDDVENAFILLNYVCVKKLKRGKKNQKICKNQSRIEEIYAYR